MRSAIFFFFAILLFLMACSDTDKPHEVTQYTIEQFMSNIRMSGGSFSYDESQLLITSDQTGIFNLFSIPVDGGEMKQLTYSDSTSIFGQSYFPDDNRILYSSDDNGNEIYQLYLLYEDGSTRNLTPDSAVRNEFYGWLHDNQGFIYGSNKLDAKYMDVYEMNIEDFKPRLLFRNKEGLKFSAISDDERYIAFVKPITRTTDQLYIYDQKSRRLQQISPRNSEASFSPMEFSADNRELYYLTNEGEEFEYLVKYDLARGTTETEMKCPWDIWYSYTSETGKYRITGINEDAKTTVEVLNNETGQHVDFPIPTAADIAKVRVSESEELMSFWVETSKSPAELYVFDLQRKEVKKLASGLNPEIDPEELVEGQVVRYASYDGLEIPAILYKPHQVSAKNPGTGIIWVHGGPGGQSRLSYFPLLQYLVNNGYTILAVNNRGSSGYGKTFYSLDDRKHGEADLLDCIAGKTYLGTLNYVDTSRMAILGGSYGGFMVMAALTMHPREFETGVNIFGVTNWLRTLQNMPPWWGAKREALYKEMGNPETDSVRLHRISPLFHANKIERPFMVLQGTKDPRVLKAESDEIVEAARKNGVQVKYVLFEDEGHGFLKRENQIEAYGQILLFLNEQLTSEPQIEGLGQ